MASDKSDSKVLRKWLISQDIFHSDLEKVLIDNNITNPEEDFKTLKESQFDEIRRQAVVLRAKDLKSQKAKVRWEKQLKKLEKFWRLQSGTKSTSIKKGSAAASKDYQAQNTSDTKQTAKYEAANDLKLWMKGQSIFDVDLFDVLVSKEIKSENDIETKITKKKQLDEILREVRVQRTADIKNTTARQRLDKTLNKFEKLVYAKNNSKLKKTSLKKDDDEKQLKEWDADIQKDKNAKEGKPIKEWLQKNDIWLIELYDGLIKCGVTSPFMIQCLEESEFDEIVRTVRVDRFSNLKDQSARNRLDKQLVQFEKLWRKESGVKKTSVTKNTYADQDK